MRAGARRAGRGLAGMAPATLFDGRVWIARPLLGRRREALRDCPARSAASAGSTTRPTSTTPIERPRLRAALDRPDGERSCRGAASTAGEAARRREALGEAAADLIHDHAGRPAPGLLRLDPAFLCADARRPSMRCASFSPSPAARRICPTRRAPPRLLARLQADEPLRGVLSRTLVDSRRDGIFLLREARGLPEPVDARRRHDLGRPVSHLRCRIASEGVTIVGSRRADRRRAESRRRRCRRLAAEALCARLWLAASQPVRTATPPNALGRTAPPLAQAIPVVAPWARFLPSFDLAPARAVAALIGAPAIPAPPLHEHNGRKA